MAWSRTAVVLSEEYQRESDVPNPKKGIENGLLLRSSVILAAWVHLPPTHHRSKRRRAPNPPNTALARTEKMC
jgi:hypothetical protein